VEHELKASEHRPVVRIGDTVRRRTYPWSDAVHSLLRHLEHVGFEHSPRFLGIDDDGREVLTFIDGTSGSDGYVEGERGADVWAMVASDAGIERFARLLRSYHDAVAGYVPEHGSEWSTGHDVHDPDHIVLHNDFWPWKVVWKGGGEPIGIIDWDFAAPGPVIDDVAYALDWVAPFCSDDEAVRLRRFDVAPDRRARIERFAAAYGLTSTDGLVDAVLRRQRSFGAHVASRALRGIQSIEARVEWTEANRSLLE
jgi:aminoglycoside phosphotransferase (APT) family kinase protein